MKTKDLAYFAGLFDGEGSVSIHKQKPRHGWNPRYPLRIEIANTDLPIIQWLLELFGGSLVVSKKRLGHKQCYAWRISDKGAEKFLKLVFPYLHIKRVRVHLALEFRKRIVSKESTFTLLPKSEIQEREKYYIALKEMNKRGE